VETGGVETARGTLAIFFIIEGFLGGGESVGRGRRAARAARGEGGGGLKVVVIFGREGQGWGVGTPSARTGCWKSWCAAGSLQREPPARRERALQAGA